MRYLLNVVLIFSMVLTANLLVCPVVYAIGGQGPLDSSNLKGTKNSKPANLEKIGIDENLGGQIDLSLPFTDEAGKEVTLQKYFGDKPVFMMLIYYQCPTLCNTHLNTLIQTLSEFEWKIGNEFEYVIVSIDPEESHVVASQKKKAYLDLYGRPESADGWHFLTGKESSIKKLASQIGFRYAWDQNTGEWNHAAASYVLTPKGKISYYHYGLNIIPKVFRLSLVEASNNEIGSVMDRLILYCLQYDPNKKTYAFYAYNIMRVAAFLMVLILGFFLTRFWIKQERTQN